jgi:hypothetical protein
VKIRGNPEAPHACLFVAAVALMVDGITYDCLPNLHVFKLIFWFLLGLFIGLFIGYVVTSTGGTTQLNEEQKHRSR